MLQLTKLVLLITTLLAASSASSDVLLLVHGYLSNYSTWSESGVIRTLESDGWQQAGVYAAEPNGRVWLRSSDFSGEEDRRIFVVDLPSEAPVLLQADLIANIVKAVSVKYPGEPIILVGHSAGGVAARAAVIRHDLKSVSRFISIASPHLGTDKAEKALGLSNLAGPVSFMPDMFGGGIARTAQRSRQLFSDLARPRQGNLLNWLNQQPHPDITWDSVIHTGRAGNGYDSIVAAYSQDMNRIPALQGRSSVHPITVDHALGQADAWVLLGLLHQPG